MELKQQNLILTDEKGFLASLIDTLAKEKEDLLAKIDKQQKQIKFLAIRATAFTLKVKNDPVEVEQTSNK
jgi:hypothetical protein